MKTTKFNIHSTFINKGRDLRLLGDGFVHSSKTTTSYKLNLFPKTFMDIQFPIVKGSSNSPML